MSSKLPVAQNEVLVKDSVCPYCKSHIPKTKAEDLVTCSVCNTLQHSKCWSDHGSCSVFGCVGTLTKEDQRQKRISKLKKIGFAFFLVILSALAIIFLKNGGLLVGSVVGFILSYLFWIAYRDPENNRMTREIWDYYQNSTLIFIHALGFFLLGIFALAWLLFSQ